MGGDPPARWPDPGAGYGCAMRPFRELNRFDDPDDPAMQPVYEAGGGEQDGWERVEAELIENATHGDGGANPIRDAFYPEAETDRSTAVYGEPDEQESTEVFDDTGAPDATHDSRAEPSP